MSIDYTAYIGLGWVIDEALYFAMQDAARIPIGGSPKLF